RVCLKPRAQFRYREFLVEISNPARCRDQCPAVALKSLPVVFVIYQDPDPVANHLPQLLLCQWFWRGWMVPITLFCDGLRNEFLRRHLVVTRPKHTDVCRIIAAVSAKAASLVIYTCFHPLHLSP